MKRLLMIVGLMLLGSFGLIAVAQGPETYNSSVNGNEMNPGTPATIVLNGEAKESLPGIYRINVRYNPETKEITGGDWIRTVLREDAEGSRSEVGTLHGNITGGTVTMNVDGRVTDVKATLAIVGGNKDYSGVPSGTGVFEGTFEIDGAQAAAHPPPQPEGTPGPDAPPPSELPNAGARPTFNGKMTLTF